MALSDRILPLCDLLLGAAYADKELKDQERDEVRKLLEELAPGGDLPIDVELRLTAFDPAKFDVQTAVAPFCGDPEDDRKKILYLVSAVNEADSEIDFAEDDYLRALCKALGLPPAALEGLTIELESVDLEETLAAVRGVPPPPPKKR